jgi:hypothetical protein
MKSFRIAVVAMSIAALALPAGAAAKQGSHGGGKLKSNAARLCKQLRADMGADAFRAAYGTGESKRNAFGKCVSQTRKTLKQLRRSAVEQCQSAVGSPATVSRHGVKAQRACVADDTADDDDAVGAGQAACEAERALDPEAFATKYGTNENHRNAFGKCVSKLAHENEAENDGEGERQAE